MKPTIFKFLICTGLILMGLAWKLSAEENKSNTPMFCFVNASYEQSLLDEVEKSIISDTKVTNVFDTKPISPDSWYHSTAGIDQCARNFLKEVPENGQTILYGISLAGVVSRRITQIAEENGKNVLGYIAQSSPLSGDRLTNKNWALTASGLLGAYTLIGFNVSNMLGFLSNILRSEDLALETFMQSELKTNENAKLLAEYMENVRSRDSSRMSSDEIIKDIAMPLIDILMGCTTRNEDNPLRFLPDVFGNYTNNVKDLDPFGSFMCNTLNSPTEMKKELKRTVKTKLENGTIKTEKQDMRRVFIVSNNGELFESEAWSYVGPVLIGLEAYCAYYWAMAYSTWLLFPIFSLKAAATTLQIATLNGLPPVWSYCVSGTTDYTKHDAFVPVDDNFNGKQLGMVAPNFRNTPNSPDLIIECVSTSHLNYGDKESPASKIENTHGRTKFSIGHDSHIEQLDAMRKAYYHVIKNN